VHIVMPKQWVLLISAASARAGFGMGAIMVVGVINTLQWVGLLPPKAYLPKCC